MRIDAYLPTNLWPWIWNAAVHLYNRTPAAYLDWRSPFELLREWLHKARRLDSDQYQPNINNLAAYGCRAYALIKRKTHRPKRKEKIEPRAYIGYLIGYQGSSSKIFHIWVPAYNEVITTQDVIFDETRFYNPNKEDRSAQLQRTLAPILDEIEYREPLPGIVDESSSESEAEAGGDQTQEEPDEAGPSRESQP